MCNCISYTKASRSGGLWFMSYACKDCVNSFLKRLDKEEQKSIFDGTQGSLLMTMEDMYGSESEQGERSERSDRSEVHLSSPEG